MEPILKPHVDMYDNSWRGYIGNQYTAEEQWQAWFKSYSEFINYYAKMSQEYGTPYFNVGTELDATEFREKEWREIISQVRETAPDVELFYGCNWYPGADAVNFWDALDYIGIDAYYPLTDHINPTLEEIKAGWQPILDKISQTATKFNKKVILAELGYASFDLAPLSPNLCCEGEVNLETQRLLFEAFFESVWN